MSLTRLERFDHWMLHTVSRVGPELMRVALCVVYVWFGGLKVLGLSPAESMVGELLMHTMPVIPFPIFLMLFGVFEMLVGLLFLFPRLTRLAILLLVLHMFTTFLPLMLLPEITWQQWFVPTLVGQYILKNVVILALALAVGLDLEPLKRSVPQRHT